MTRSLVLDFAEKARSSKCLADLVEQLQTATNSIGFERWAYATMAAGENAKATILHNYPAAWVEHYTSRNYGDIDPVITLGTKQGTPFQWTSLYATKELDRKERDYCQEANEFGLVDGLGIPLSGLGRSYSLFSMASNESKEDICQQLEVNGHEFIALAYVFHCVADEFIRPSLLQVSGQQLLSLREKECLLWAMRGKSSWEIAQIIKTTERTINFHISNAKKKLGVSNRAQAVVKAIIEGQITP